ncbi:hypothetical protein [Luteimonas sp. FCS-9]|uniref:hypothetical protein n=1 Tax=Luteimonas sp. FCS-9 TaxID=1547516 RepID=UPI00063E8CCB|nr:hypothetical protein [Luteimonas sp. FCS-9]KLJ00609.1 hypothetical protein WQ56_09300 [Luteimonas sp. FCS-9]
MQGRKRVEARWSDLQPYFEVMRAAHAAGASSVMILRLVHLSEDGRSAISQIKVSGHLISARAAAAYYEFLCRYMAGDWEALPEIRLIGGIRRPLLQEFRLDGINFWMGAYDWSERRPIGKLLMWVFVPVWTVLLWPFHMLTLLGSRLGWVPQFPQKDLDEAAYDPGKDGPIPEALARKIQPLGEIALPERVLYIGSILLGGGLWVWLIAWMSTLEW